MLKRIAASSWSSRRPRLPIASVLTSVMNLPSPVRNIVRTKYINYGIQGKRENKQIVEKKNKMFLDDELIPDKIEQMVNIENDVEYESLANNAMHVSRSIRHEQNVLVIQPYIKWGPRKSVVKPDVQLKEAEALIKSLDQWNIQQTLKIPLLNYDKRTFFGKGKIAELHTLVKQLAAANKKITCVFISRSVLTYAQKSFLEDVFKVPVMDRYSVVIQILRVHATSRESKLQVALAEIPYVWKHLGDHGSLGQLGDAQKLLLRCREKQIKTELEAVRGHRQLLRKRRSAHYPTIAVVGYTNAGKTALIKALTSEEAIQPKNKLFATLEITAHGGVLPCNLNVIFMDTIGFMADIPTGLLECFVATLEDALVADLIIHVQDLSHENSVEQRKHVEKTLKALLKTGDEEKQKLLSSIITVGNKCDLVADIETATQLMACNNDSPVQHVISSITMQGLNALRFDIEGNILRITERIKMIMRVPMGGNELAWLYKNSAVTRTLTDPNNDEYLMVHVVITELAIQQFKNEFLQKKKS